MAYKIKRVMNADEISLKEAFDEFIEAKTANNLSPSTIYNYQTTFSIFWNDNEFTDETECNEIEEKTFYRWINIMKNRDCSIQSINHYLRDMRTFINWCIEHEYVKPFKIKLLVSQEEQIKFFTDEEVEKLLEEPGRKESFATWRMWAIVNFIFATGARSATICNLRIEDLNFSKSVVVYRHTKNKKAQEVPLSQSLQTALKKYMKQFRPAAVGWLFPSILDEQLTRNALRLSFERYCKDRGVSHANIHGLRHSFARGWILNNGNTLALKSVLGHSTTAMTSKYVKLWGEDLREGYEDFSPLDQMKKNKTRKQKITRNQ